MRKNLFQLAAIAALTISNFALVSCKENNDVNPSESAVIEFKDLDVQTVQQLILGTWKIVQQCGGVVGCVDVTDSFHKYADANKLHITNGDKTDDKNITEWRKATDGYEIIVSTADSDSVYIFTLNRLTGDTLSFDTHTNKLPVFSWRAIRVK
jgi:hypothetical protein